MRHINQNTYVVTKEVSKRQPYYQQSRQIQNENLYGNSGAEQDKG